MLSINPHPTTTTGVEKGGKGRETYKLNIKTALLITLIMLIKLMVREIKQNVENRY